VLSRNSNSNLVQAEYKIRRHVLLTPAHPNPYKRFKRQASGPDPVEQAGAPPAEVHHGVVCDQVVTTTASREAVLSLIKEHVTANLIKVSQCPVASLR